MSKYLRKFAFIFVPLMRFANIKFLIFSKHLYNSNCMKCKQDDFIKIRKQTVVYVVAYIHHFKHG